MGYVFGQAYELRHGVETRGIVDANVPSAFMARGDNGAVYLRPGAAAGLSQQSS